MAATNHNEQENKSDLIYEALLCKLKGFNYKNKDIYIYNYDAEHSKEEKVYYQQP